MKNAIAVWWVKRDARLADNACLSEAHRCGFEVLPFFCVEPALIAAEDFSAMHGHAQRQAIMGLREQLRERDADILIGHGEMVDKLAKLRTCVPFTHLFAHEEVGNSVTYRRDQAVAAWCRVHGVEYREFPQSSVRRGGVNRDRLHEVWRQRIVDRSPEPAAALRQSAQWRLFAAASDFPRLTELRGRPAWQSVSENDGQRTLQDFLDFRGVRYRGGISSPNTAFEAGSRLSVHLAWGTLSVRQVWHAVQQRLAELDPADPATPRWRDSLHAFVSRLHWRDHFTQRLESEPDLEFRSIHPSYRAIPYENDPALLAAWQNGRTGYPLIDAVMRCLAEVGFVNFRMRAMVVSFACHVLHLDWRLIHPHLARVFRDYDPGIHLNQLQMQAGVVGWNAIRVYNPSKQLQDWDPSGRFVKRWVPELRGVSADRLVQGDCSTARDYPPPVVSFAERARHMTDLLYSIRRSEDARRHTPAVYAKHGSRRSEFRRPRSVRRSRSSPLLPDTPRSSTPSKPQFKTQRSHTPQPTAGPTLFDAWDPGE